MIEIDNEVIEKIKSFGLYTNNEEAIDLLSHYIPMESSFYHSHKTPKVFKNVHLLQESANRKLSTGRYCEYPFLSKKFNEWANEEIRRCKEGYTINKGTEDELSITGYHYFFLNFKQIMFEKEESDKAQGRDWQFPEFMAIQYHFFWSFEECRIKRENFIVLKPRGIGFSEMVSSIACCNYVIHKDANFLFAMQEDTLLKDGLFTKVTSNLDFLNRESDYLFFHNRLIDKSLHKQAGDKLKNAKSKRTGGEIIGKVIDSPRKARGSRGMLIAFEEGGSFKDLIKAFNTALASITQTGGKQFGTIIVFGTGGDENSEYLQGLQEMFYHPDSFRAKVFKNKWGKQQYNKDCGWFAPTYYYSLSGEFADKDGNVDTLGGFLSLMKERKRDGKNSLSQDNLNQRIEEYPITPEEALQRKGRNKFPTQELEAQRLWLETNPVYLNAWNNGWLTRNENGKIVFRPDDKAVPLNDYPIKINAAGNIGCVSILQHPRKLQNGNIAPIYDISVDGYSEDEITHSDSVGAIYVYKGYSKLIDKDNLSGNIVAKYVGRLPKTRDFARLCLDLTEYYGAIGRLHFEKRGGGKIVYDYAESKNKKHYLATTVNKAFYGMKEKYTTYGNHFTAEENRLGLDYLRDWLLEEVEILEEKEKLTYKYRLHNIYDIGLLKELINFVENNNYDRISAMRQLMFVVKDEDKPQEQSSFVNPYRKIDFSSFFRR